MRKTIMLGTLITLFGAGALAQAKDVTTTEPKSTIEASQPEAPAARDDGRERHSAARAERREHHERRDGSREHHDEGRESHDGHRKHDGHH